MTIPNETNISGPYNGNGVTVAFDYEFRIVDQTHIRVVKAVGDVETVLTLGVDYSVTGVGNNEGGQVICTPAPATGSTITNLRNAPFTQETDLENQGAYYAETVERALDLGVSRDQQLAELLSRAPKLPPGLLPGRTEMPQDGHTLVWVVNGSVIAIANGLNEAAEAAAWRAAFAGHEVRLVSLEALTAAHSQHLTELDAEQAAQNATLANHGGRISAVEPVVADLSARAVRVPNGEPSVTLPPAAQRALKWGAYSVNGDPIAVPPPAVLTAAEATFPSFLMASGGIVPAIQQQVTTAGFYAAGDAGGGHYREAVAEPSHAAKFQAADGRWFELDERMPNARQFGARGNNAADDYQALQDLFDFAVVCHIPFGQYRVSQQLELPTTRPITIYGDGGLAFTNNGTTIIATAPMTAVINRSAAGGTIIRGGIHELGVSANKIAEHAIIIRTGKGFALKGCRFIDATITNGLFGHDTTPRFYEADITGNEFCSTGTGAGQPFENPADLPNYNFRLIGYATDNIIINNTMANAKLANVLSQPGNNTFIGNHTFGSPATHFAQFGFDVWDNHTLIGNFSDGSTVAAYRLRGSDITAQGNLCFWLPGTGSGDGFLLSGNQNSIYITGNRYLNLPAGGKKVALLSGAWPTNSQVLDNFLGGTGDRLLIGGNSLFYSVGGSTSSLAQLWSTAATTAISLGRSAADSNGFSIYFAKSRGAAAGTFGAVVAGDTLGALSFYGDDGANYTAAAARILAQVDGAPAAGSVPGRLSFYTTALAAANPREVFRMNEKSELVHVPSSIPVVTADGHLRCRGYTVAGLPSAAVAGQMVYVSNESGGSVIAYSDGANWRRMTDRAVVS